MDLTRVVVSPKEYGKNTEMERVVYTKNYLPWNLSWVKWEERTHGELGIINEFSDKWIESGLNIVSVGALVDIS